MSPEFLTVLDLFAGCGGLSVGLHQAGFRVQWANEFDPSAARTYKLNHPTTTLWQSDVRELLNGVSSGRSGFPKRGEVSLLAGGPPCQGFCQINRHRHFGDTRNSLVEVFFDFVDALRPRAVLMENVTGILTLGDGQAITSLLSALSNLRYQPALGIIQAGSFGVPQNRWRVFIVATARGERPPVFPAPTHRFHKTNFVGMPAWKKHLIEAPHTPDLFNRPLMPGTFVSDAISDLPFEIPLGGAGSTPYATPPKSDYQKELRNGADSVANHECSRFAAITLQRVKLIPEGGGWLDLPDDLKPHNLKNYTKRSGSFNNRFGRLSWAGCFSTIITKPEPYWGRYLHPVAHRVISVRECARAQSFPDTFVFTGPTSSQYRQVGNAVPPHLARAIGLQISQTLLGGIPT